MKDLLKMKYRLVERKYDAGYVEYTVQYRYFFIWLDIKSYRQLSEAQEVFKYLIESHVAPVETVLETK